VHTAAEQTLILPNCWQKCQSIGKNILMPIGWQKLPKYWQKLRAGRRATEGPKAKILVT
jgi:hypothetical protein